MANNVDRDRTAPSRTTMLVQTIRYVPVSSEYFEFAACLPTTGISILGE